MLYGLETRYRSVELLSLLGVPRETIVADYAFSRQNIDRINERLDSSDTYKNLMHTMPDDAYDADPAAMESFLNRVDDAHGGVEAIDDENVVGIGHDTRRALCSSPELVHVRQMCTGVPARIWAAFF